MRWMELLSHRQAGIALGMKERSASRKRNDDDGYDDDGSSKYLVQLAVDGVATILCAGPSAENERVDGNDVRLASTEAVAKELAQRTRVRRARIAFAALVADVQWPSVAKIAGEAEGTRVPRISGKPLRA